MYIILNHGLWTLFASTVKSICTGYLTKQNGTPFWDGRISLEASSGVSFDSCLVVLLKLGRMSGALLSVVWFFGLVSIQKN